MYHMPMLWQLKFKFLNSNPACAHCIVMAKFTRNRHRNSRGNRLGSCISHPEELDRDCTEQERSYMHDPDPGTVTGTHQRCGKNRDLKQRYSHHAALGLSELEFGTTLFRCA